MGKQYILYSIWNNHTDELLCFEEPLDKAAEIVGIAPASIRSAASREGTPKNMKYHIETTRIKRYPEKPKTDHKRGVPPKPIVALDPKTHKVVKRFESIRDAGRRSYMSYSTVSHICNGKNKSFVAANGYEYRFEDDLK